MKHRLRNPNRKKRKGNAQACRETVEALKIPQYCEDIWTDTLEVTLADGDTITVGLTSHAQTRMAQRGISKDAIALVLKYGRKVHGQRAVIYFFGQKEFNRYLSKDQAAGRWNVYLNIHVIISDNTVVTTYKNRKIGVKADF